MGCASSTEYGTAADGSPQVVKKTLGGAYPGQRRPQHAPHVPAASDFGPDGTAVVHFMAYGGGNALQLVPAEKPQNFGHPSNYYNGDGSSAQPPQFIQVTLPEGIVAGQTIHVQAPDGRLNAIVVPPGMGAGSTFTVEFAPDPDAAPLPEAIPPPLIPTPYTNTTAYPNTTTNYSNNNNNSNSNTNGSHIPEVTAYPVYDTPASYPNSSAPARVHDDGFVSGFGK